MADVKISQLTSATTPLAGTEVLPIVQSGSTVKVAVSNLTAGRDVVSSTVQAIAAATQDSVKLQGRAGGTGSYIATITPTTLSASTTVTLPNASTTIPIATQQLTFSGPSAARTITLPDANFTAARTDAANSFTGDQTLSTGNLIQGTAAKGVNFTANTATAGSTSRLLNWYEEGTWTGTLAGSVSNPTTPVTATGRYTRVGRMVQFQISFDGVTTTGASGSVTVTGLPFYSRGTRTVHTTALYQFDMNTGTSVFGLLLADDTTLSFYASKTGVDWQPILHSPGTSRYLTVSGTYITN